MAAALHISISAEKVFSFAGVSITNSMLTSIVASGLLILFALWVSLNIKNTNRPKGVQNIAEMIVEGLYNLVHGVASHEKKTKQFFPIIATFFLFILVNNWLGLLPGVGTIGFYEKEAATQTTAAESSTQAPEVKQATEASSEPIFVPYFRAGTADLNMTLALGLISVALIQVFGVQYQHLGYFKKFINFSNPINFFVGILEIVSEFSRIVSFAFRLFGNVFAGEVLLAVIGYLTKIVGPMPFYGMEIFVGFIQALVFAMLSVVLFNMATHGHGGENPELHH
jgi:F-type H+-transporting ATPase subunit a